MWRVPTCILCHIVHILLPHFSHVAQHGEDDEAGQEAGQTVHRAGDQRVSDGGSNVTQEDDKVREPMQSIQTCDASTNKDISRIQEIKHFCSTAGNTERADDTDL